MLAYPLEEAETLLDGRLTNAKKSLENCEEDLEFLREQITVCLHCAPLQHCFGMRIDAFLGRRWRLQ